MFKGFFFSSDSSKNLRAPLQFLEGVTHNVFIYSRKRPGY